MNIETIQAQASLLNAPPCQICSKNFEVDQRIARLSCNHIFHPSCVVHTRFCSVRYCTLDTPFKTQAGTIDPWVKKMMSYIELTEEWDEDGIQSMVDSSLEKISYGFSYGDWEELPFLTDFEWNAVRQSLEHQLKSHPKDQVQNLLKSIFESSSLIRLIETQKCSFIMQQVQYMNTLNDDELSRYVHLLREPIRFFFFQHLKDSDLEGAKHIHSSIVISIMNESYEGTCLTFIKVFSSLLIVSGLFYSAFISE